jgi:dephospho-CoA kinase
MTIIGITGTLGAGKGTVAEYLVEQKGFTHFSVRAFLEEEIVKRGLEVSRDSMVIVANDLRKNFGPAYIIEQLVAQAVEQGNDSVIESVRGTGEAEALKKMGALLLSVDADQRVRYERILSRKSNTDEITFEKFVADEEREMNSDDPTKQSIASVMRMADIHITNNETKEELWEVLESTLKNYCS